MLALQRDGHWYDYTSVPSTMVGNGKRRQNVSVQSDLHALQSRTILIVDDETAVLMFVGDFLCDLGYIIIEARDAAEALRSWAKHRQFDMVITDIGLPSGLNGRQLADALRVSA